MLPVMSDGSQRGNRQLAPGRDARETERARGFLQILRHLVHAGQQVEQQVPLHPGQDQQDRGEVHPTGHLDHEHARSAGNSAVAGIEPTISAIGARTRWKRGLSLAASATGSVHASEIA